MKIRENNNIARKILSSAAERNAMLQRNTVPMDESTVTIPVATISAEVRGADSIATGVQQLYKQFWELITSLPVVTLLQKQIVAYQTLAKQEAAKDIAKADLESLRLAKAGISIAGTSLTALQQLTKLLEQNSPGKIGQFTELCNRLNEISKEELVAKITSEWQIDDGSLLDRIVNWLEISKVDQKELTDNSDIEARLDEVTVNNAATHRIEEGLQAKAVRDIILPYYINYTPDIGIKPCSELLNELILPNTSKHTLKETKNLLEQQHQQVMKIYDNWQDSSKEDIYAWALERKGKFAHNIEDICELIAVMSRANELVTGGHKLRDSQILSLLVFVQNTFALQEESDNLHGRLCQIHTGEGKTTIVSLLAIIQAMQGQKVDVITSNNILASKAVEDKTDLYSLFGITATTNNPVKTLETEDGQIFNVDVGNTAVINKVGPPNCYKADVVYGSIGNFQFDYLKDYFLEQETRVKREFGVVILDEVDSMLIDNGRHIAKLAVPFAGMESLRYLYIKIWQELTQLTMDIDYYDLTEFDRQSKITEISNTIKQQINNDKQLLDLIPKYLQSYVARLIDQWISNAIQAKYTYKENEQYVIKVLQDREGEKAIIPVDYLNTGISLKNTVWSNGLHQFLQLKHNLEVTVETLTNSHISNMGYIKKYGSKIYGMTGTLGSSTERDLLSKIYQVNAAEVPTYKPKNFTELPCRIVEDQQWLDATILSVLQQIEASRAVLVICETIEAVRVIKKALEIFNSLEKVAKIDGVARKHINKIEIYIDDDSKVTESKVGAGEVIIATNIAGRGTDLQTTDELEQNGGLHVCVTFLPCNQRVEDQAFGRTSRQGKTGTAQLVLTKSEIEKLGLEFNHNMDQNINSMEIVKTRRFELEKAKIEEVLAKAVELDWQDMLCDSFVQLCKEFKQENNQSAYLNYLLEDLKELWAFWLEENAIKPADLPCSVSNNILEQKALLQPLVEQQLEKFKKIASILLTGKAVNKQGEIGECSTAERIIHNPYNAVKQAEYFLEHNDLLNHSLAQVVALLKQAIELGGNEKIASSYLKLFESKITGNNLLARKLATILAGIFKIEVPTISNNNYKEEAKLFLQQASNTIEKEIFYLKELLATGEQINPIILSASSEISQQRILKEHSLQSALEVANFDSILIDMEEIPIAKNPEELRYILASLPDIRVGEVIKIAYQHEPNLSVNQENQPISTIISLVRQEGGQLRISYHDKYNSKVPYQVKWELSKYCQLLEKVANVSLKEVIAEEKRIIKQLPQELTTSKSKFIQQEELLSNNLLFKHLYAKLAALSLQKDNIEQLTENVCSAYDKLEDLLISRKISELEKIAVEEKILKKSDVNELINIGLGQNYALKLIADPTKEYVNRHDQENSLIPFVTMIKNGINLLKLATQIPFLAKPIEQVSYLLISDGIVQVAANILDQRIDSAYLVAKVISNFDKTNQELAAVIDKTIMLAIKTSQGLTEVNRELPEIDLSSALPYGTTEITGQFLDVQDFELLG